MTTPTRDRVREARDEVVNAAWAMAEAEEHTHGAFAEACARHDRALDAFRDALLDAVDEDVAKGRMMDIGHHTYVHLDDARAAIRARKETT